jgi:iron(III) transport system ATP-binding protein
MIDGNTVFKSDGGMTIPLANAENQSGDNRIAMFRPQDIAIQLPDCGVSEGEVAIFGKVNHREFLGSLVRYGVTVGEHIIAVDDSHSAGRRTFETGDDVVLNLTVKQVKILFD